MRTIRAPLKIAFSRVDSCDLGAFQAEFDRLSENDDDPISAWLRASRARGKIIDENEPIILLLIELHRKIDALSAQIEANPKDYLKLENEAILDSIGHNLLIFGEDTLQSGAKYYARLEVAVFPVRKIPLFFTARDSRNAEITLIHSRDEADFDGYIAARERSIIREGKNRG